MGAIHLVCQLLLLFHKKFTKESCKSKPGQSFMVNSIMNLFLHSIMLTFHQMASCGSSLNWGLCRNPTWVYASVMHFLSHHGAQSSRCPLMPLPTHHPPWVCTISGSLACCWGGGLPRGSRLWGISTCIHVNSNSLIMIAVTTDHVP